MTVADLITELSKLDPKMGVVVSQDTTDLHLSVASVEVRNLLDEYNRLLQFDSLEPDAKPYAVLRIVG